MKNLVVYGLIVLSGLAFSFNKPSVNITDVNQFLKKVQEAYSRESIQLSFNLNSYAGTQVVFETSGELKKTGDKIYKRMDLVTAISDGEYLVTIDDRLMKIFYSPITTVFREESKLVPELGEGLELLSENDDTISFLVQFSGEEPNKIVYDFDKKSNLLTKVTQTDNIENATYKTEIVYNNSDIDISIDENVFSLNSIVTGKEGKAQLNSSYSTKGYSFANTFINSIDNE